MLQPLHAVTLTWTALWYTVYSMTNIIYISSAKFGLYRSLYISTLEKYQITALDTGIHFTQGKSVLLMRTIGDDEYLYTHHICTVWTVVRYDKT